MILNDIEESMIYANDNNLNDLNYIQNLKDYSIMNKIEGIIYQNMHYQKELISIKYYMKRINKN